MTNAAFQLCRANGAHHSDFGLVRISQFATGVLRSYRTVSLPIINEMKSDLHRLCKVIVTVARKIKFYKGTTTAPLAYYIYDFCHILCKSCQLAAILFP